MPLYRISTAVACSEVRHCLHTLPLYTPFCPWLRKSKQHLIPFSSQDYHISESDCVMHFDLGRISTRIVVVRFLLPSNWRKPALRSMRPAVIEGSSEAQRSSSFQDRRAKGRECSAHPSSTTVFSFYKH